MGFALRRFHEALCTLLNPSAPKARAERTASTMTHDSSPPKAQTVAPARGGAASTGSPTKSGAREPRAGVPKPRSGLDERPQDHDRDDPDRDRREQRHAQGGEHGDGGGGGFGPAGGERGRRDHGD